MQNNKEFINELLKLMKENPTLPIKCMVDSNVVAEDGYAWWLGEVDINCKPEIREYSTEIDDVVQFKDDEEYDYWFDRLYLEDKYDIENVLENEWETFFEACVNKEVKWEEAIFIKITI